MFGYRSLVNRVAVGRFASSFRLTPSFKFPSSVSSSSSVSLSLPSLNKFNVRHSSSKGMHGDDVPEIEITASLNKDGDVVGIFENEEVIFPQIAPTIDYALSSPPDLHLFHEYPIIKRCPEQMDDDYHHH